MWGCSACSQLHIFILCMIHILNQLLFHTELLHRPRQTSCYGLYFKSTVFWLVAPQKQKGVGLLCSQRLRWPCLYGPRSYWGSLCVAWDQFGMGDPNRSSCCQDHTRNQECTNTAIMIRWRFVRLSWFCTKKVQFSLRISRERVQWSWDLCNIFG